MITSIAIFSLVSFILFFMSAIISKKLNLIDIPNKRKMHSQGTVYTGGIVLSILLAFSVLIFDINDNNLNLILSIGFLISLVGFVDDKYSLNAGGKLSLQILPIFYLIVFENLFVNSLGDYGRYNLELGAFKVTFTLLAVLFLVNAFNYFDGIDGLLGLTSLSILSILYFLVQDDNFRNFLSILSIPIFIFLIFNFSFFGVPKIFLGDSGSLLLGFLISFLLIYLSYNELVHPILLAWSINIFVYEFICLHFIRLKNKKNLFRPGKDHLHHILFKKTKSILLTNFVIILINVTFFTVGYLSFLLSGASISLYLYILLFIVFAIFRINKK